MRNIILVSTFLLFVGVANSVSAKSLQSEYCEMVWSELESNMGFIKHTKELLSREYKKRRQDRSEYMKDYENDVIEVLSEAADWSTIWNNACKAYH
jgi:hypothetical protein